jgi:hypothetical protein
MQTKHIVLGLVACCVLVMIGMGACVAVGYFGFQAAQKEIESGKAQAIAFLDAINQGDDQKAYGMLSSSGRSSISEQELVRNAEELRQNLGTFTATAGGLMGGRADLKVENQEWRYTDTYTLSGSKGSRTVQITMYRPNQQAPWQVENVTWNTGGSGSTGAGNP